MPRSSRLFDSVTPFDQVAEEAHVVGRVEREAREDVVAPNLGAVRPAVECVVGDRRLGAAGLGARAAAAVRGLPVGGERVMQVASRRSR